MILDETVGAQFAPLYLSGQHPDAVNRFRLLLRLILDIEPARELWRTNVARFLLLILQDVAWLAFEGLAESVESGKTDGFGLTRFQDGKVGKGNTHAVGQFGKRHLTTGHHDIEVYAYHTVN